jgi:hypothetical protein
MKNFIFVAFASFLMVCSMKAQTYSTGNIVFFGNYSGQIDVTNTTVTLKLVGPSTSWMGVGFNAQSMDDIGMDVVIFNGTAVTDRTLNGTGFTPLLDGSQDWSISSNTVVSGVRTAVLTRARDTGDVNDYVFPASAQSLNLIFARSIGSTVVGYHGLGNCGATIADFALGTTDFAVSQFKMYPNPSHSFTTFELPSSISEAKVSVYDSSGKMVKNASLISAENKFDTSTLQKGFYMMKVSAEGGTATKILVVN